ncbi:unnamed protein product [Callosobruchus maculatus]|uniref:Ribosome-binding factor A, mitochondrial n=1 Tax=Callosobruchus maculatus TaxID=64391 RepID=A0A653C4S5_CALMS|nr:unnamed protein product [Callosobruchus maculatus]
MRIPHLKSCIQLQKCYLHSTNILTNRQAANAMTKVLGMKKRKFYFDDSRPAIPSPENFSKGSSDGKRGDPRRVTILNKLFMRHITDQMATGQYASEILGHGIEVNKVKVTPDYRILRVYWIARKSKSDEAIEKILIRNAGFLRHELSSLQLMGKIPVIQFIKDKEYGSISEVDNRLAIADFGEDHIPLDPADKLKCELELCVPLEENIKERIKESEEFSEIEDVPLPAMPQNVLGLDHAAILNKVKKLMKKSEAIHRQSSTGNEETWAKFKLNQSVNADPLIFGTGKTQREAFKEFLQKRQLMKQKARRLKNYTPDIEYIKEELQERHNMNMLQKFNMWENVDDNDFIEEDPDDLEVK